MPRLTYSLSGMFAFITIFGMHFACPNLIIALIATVYVGFILASALSPIAILIVMCKGVGISHLDFRNCRYLVVLGRVYTILVAFTYLFFCSAFLFANH